VAVEEQVIAWLARQKGAAAYLVGGCVRDRLLGRPLYDLDLALDGDGLLLARRLANHFQGAYYPLDEARGTGRAILPGGEDGPLVVDIARFRGPELGADLADRDFTINALAADVRRPQEVIDHTGGLADLAARLIRPVSADSIRNDPLRALRAVRLAAQLGFALAADTQALIRRDGPALGQMAGERVRDELARLLALPQAASSLDRLDELGLLTVILPELAPLRGLAQPPPHHLDVLAHSLATVHALEKILEAMAGADQAQATRLAALSPFFDRLRAHLALVMSDARPRLVTLKLAALLHDTGKAAAHTMDEGGRIRFLGHERESSRLASDAMRRLRFARPEVRLGTTIVQHHMRPLLLAQQNSVSSRAVYRFFRDNQEAGIDVLCHALADHQATYAPGAADGDWPRLVALTARMLGDYWQRQPERIDPPPLLTGADLLREFGLQPGPQIGDLLEAVREAQVSGEVRSREEARALVGSILAAKD
jgi:tRNA nucleotidyltransferase/poly(A) polymerase